MTTNDITLGVYHSPTPPASRWTDTLREFEASGWESCWVPDHLMGETPPSIWDPELVELAEYQESQHAFFDALSLLGYAAAVTKKIDLGVGVTDPLRRHPVVLAQTMQTLHHLSEGRMLFGLSAGTRSMTEPYGIEYHRPVSRLEEALQIIRLAWETDQDEPFDFAGEFWELEDAISSLPPVRGDDVTSHPEIFLGAHGPRMRSLTGKYADGWYPSFLTPALYAEGWETVEQAATEAGRDAEEITRALVSAVMVAEAPEEAETRLDSLLVRLLSLYLPPQSFESCGYDHPLGNGQTTFVQSRVGRREALELAESVPLEVIKDAYIWGTPSDVVETIDEHTAAGVEHLALANLTPLAAVEQTGHSFALLEEVRETVQS